MPTTNTTETVQIHSVLGDTQSILVQIDDVPVATPAPTTRQPLALDGDLEFTLDIPDDTFSYAFVIDSTSAPCLNAGQSVTCRLDALPLQQGKTYDYTLRRQLGVQHTPAQAGQITIATPLTIEPTTIEQQQTIFTEISQITLVANKPVQSVGDEATLIDGSSGEAIPLTISATDTTITITAGQPLPRSRTFNLTVPTATATDSSYLEKPFELEFYTSGGPSISSYNIGTTRVSQYTDIVATYNIGISDAQDISSLVSLNVGGSPAAISVRHSGNTITVDPEQALPKCTTFTVTFASGIESIHGIPNTTGQSHTAKTACYTTAAIGTSVNGRSITAYTFGSGAKTVVFVGGLHGTERSSVHTLEAWIDELETNYADIPSNVTVRVIPNASPDSYATWSRTNANGVDLNRNFPSADWVSDVYQPGSVELAGGGGDEPLSEPESAALAAYISNTGPSLVLTYHAVARAVISNGSGNSHQLAQTYASHAGYSVGTAATEDAIFAYPTTGEFETWLHDTMGIPTLLVENATTSSNEIASHRSAMWAMLK